MSSSAGGSVGGEREPEISKCFCYIWGLPKMLGMHSGILATPMWPLPSRLVGFVAFV